MPAATADGDTLTYYLYDTNKAANSGHFIVSGTMVAAKRSMPISAAQLAQITYVAGAAGTSDKIYVQAYDGQPLFGMECGMHVARGRRLNHAPTVNLPAGAN